MPLMYQFKIILFLIDSEVSLLYYLNLRLYFFDDFLLDVYIFLIACMYFLTFFLIKYHLFYVFLFIVFIRQVS
jgi:hypothetical protein